MAATLKCDTITNASNTGTANLSLDEYSNVKINGASLSPAASATNTGNLATTGTVAMGSSFLRNRLINGDMRIDQRNAGASVTATDGGYTLDRFQTFAQPGVGAFTVQQVTDAPTGFSNSVKMTVSSAASSISAAHRYLFLQNIEGYNIADLNWGSASAAPVTVSFWVKSSVTGTFSASLCLSFTPSIPFSFVIGSANVWTKVSATVAGPTSGSWGTTNNLGMRLIFNLGLGSNYLGPNNTWDYINVIWGVTGQTNLISTNGATFYITGVQLEVGSIATPFERRQYGEELLLAQRYYWTLGAGLNSWMGNSYWFSSTQVNCPVVFPVQMRAVPVLNVANGSAYFKVDTPSSQTTSTLVLYQPTTYGCLIYSGSWSATQSAGYAAGLISNNASAYCGFSAEL